VTAAAPEVPIWLEINGRRRTCWSGSPGDIETLVQGYLLTTGYLESPAELNLLELIEEPAGCKGARVSVPEANVVKVAREQRHMRESGCGALHFVLCEPETFRRPRLVAPPRPEALREAFRALFAATDAAWPEGGMHAAALWCGDRLLPPAFDVGRHNAVDRAIGAAARMVELARCGLVLSSRISGAIAIKAARVGVGFIASRSIPTSLAAQLCDCASLPVVARAGRTSSEGGGG
jgi:FdhD protein